MIYPPGKSMIFYKKETEKIELEARPAPEHVPGGGFGSKLEHEQIENWKSGAH